MNSWDRVMNTLEGTATDRVPVFGVLGAYGGLLTGTELETMYRDARLYAAGQRAVRDAFGLDMILTPFDYSAIVEAFGGAVSYFPDQAPNMRRPSAATPDEALRLPLPDPHSTARLPVILESIRIMADEYRGEAPLFAPLPGPCVLPSLLVGLETWMETVLFDPQTARRLLDFCAVFFEAWGNALLAAGATGLIVTEGMAAAELVTRDIFATVFLPHLTSTLDRLQGPVVMHHTGGRINHVLDLLRALPNTVGFGIGSKDSLTEARSLIGDQALLIGNLDNLSFPGATAAGMFERSTRVLEEAAGSGHFILCNSGADIPLSTPPENIRAMVAASEARGEVKGVAR